MLRTLHTCTKDVIVAGMAHIHTMTNQVPALENHNPALATPSGLNVAPILERALVKG
jgi:hypothetical protein